MSDHEHELNTAIDAVYREFGRLPPNARIYFCGCDRSTCPATPELATAINQDDVRMVTDQQLLHFLDGYHSLIGGPYELKRMFPRIMEYLVTGKIEHGGSERHAEYFCPNAEEVFAIVLNAGFPDWSESEKAAAQDYFVSLWKYVLENESEWQRGFQSITYPSVAFNCIATVVDSLDPYLELWQRLPADSSIEALVQYINGSAEIFEADFGFNHEQVDERYAASIRMKKRQLMKWLISPAVERLVSDYAQRADLEAQSRCLDALDSLNILRESPAFIPAE